MKISFLFISGILLTGCFAKDPEKTGHEGEKMPSFNILLSDSITYFNTKNITKNKAAVLFYYGPHCTYSQAQIEEITGDIEKLKDLEIYAFTSASFSEMIEFSKRNHLDKYPNIHIGQDYTNFFGDYFEVTGVPYTAVYGKDKTLHKAFMGKVYSGQIRKTAEE